MPPKKKGGAKKAKGAAGKRATKLDLKEKDELEIEVDEIEVEEQNVSIPPVPEVSRN